MKCFDVDMDKVAEGLGLKLKPILEPHKLSERVEEKIKQELKDNPHLGSVDALRQRLLMDELDNMYDMLYSIIEDFERYKYLERKKK